MSLVESLLGFRTHTTPLMQHRNSVIRLMLYNTIPNLCVLLLFQLVLGEKPFMDEQFHYGQFIHYSEGNYHYYDPKLTTPPGLYHLQVLATKLIGCSLFSMRALNAIFFSNLLAVFTLKILELQSPNPTNIARTLNFLMTPTLYFFNFLDYTDIASLSFVAMSFYYSSVKCRNRLFFSSLLAVYVRQNNLIWVCGYIPLHEILTQHSKAFNSSRSLTQHAVHLVRLLWTHRMPIITQNKLQILVGVATAAYLKVYNQGKLVFGDHQNHQVSIHPTQLLYLALFCSLSLPFTISEWQGSIMRSLEKIYYSRHSLAAFLLCLSVSLLIVSHFSLLHPFILADNRHYTFYLYRYLYKHELFRLLMCIPYAFSLVFLVRALVDCQERLLKLLLWTGASAAYLCGSQLVEFRYFSVPLLLLTSQLRIPSMSIDVEQVHKSEKMEQLSNRMLWSNIAKVAINAAVIGYFLLRAFKSPDGSIGRIMW